MRVHLIKRQTVLDFKTSNAASRIPLEEWLTKIKFADWETPADMQDTFGSADLLAKHSSRVVFNIGGNKYRMICKYAFGEKEVHLFICWIGTHAEYDKLNDEGRQYSINIY
jgi:mRNA interferase HigB